MNEPVRFGLRARLLVFTLGLTAATSAGVWYFSTQKTHDALVDASMKELGLGSKNLADAISENLDDAYADAVTSARLDIVAQAIDSGDPKNFRWYAGELVRTKPKYVAIVAADIDHRIIATNVKRNGIDLDVQDKKIDDDWIEKAIDSEPSKGVFVPPTRPKWLEPVLGPNERVVGFSLPVVDVLEETVGTLTVLCSVDHFGRILGGFTDADSGALASVAILTDSSGAIVAAPEALPWSGVAFANDSTTWRSPDGAGFAMRTSALGAGFGAADWRVAALRSEETIEAPVSAVGRSLLAASALGLVLMAIGLAIVSGRIVEPIRLLMHATRQGQRVSEIKPIAVRSADEVGVLTASFNRMIAALREYEDGLERKVEERTAALTRAQREMQDILDNVSQGMFTVGRDGRINGGYSAFTPGMFGGDDVRGADALALMQVTEERDVMTASKMRFWLENVFGADELQWMLAEDEPVKTWEIERAGGEKRILEIEYAPIFEADEVEKIMVVAKDITEIKALEAEVVKKEAEKQTCLSRMSELANVDPQLLDTFLTETKEVLSVSNGSLEALEQNPAERDAIHALFRAVHTIKGNARIFNIRSVQDHAHRVESDLDPLRSGTEPLSEEQLATIRERVESIGTLIAELEAMARPLLDRISSTSNGPRLDDAAVQRVERGYEALRRLGASGDETKEAMADLGRAIRALKMRPLSEVFDRLRQMVLDLGQDLDKPIRELSIECDDLFIDAEAADRIREAVMHVLRNAIDHGIESRDERRDADKPEWANLAIVGRVEGEDLVIEVRDDGRGIDKERIRAVAGRRAIVDEDTLEDMITHDLLQLVFRAGFSTKEAVTDVSGRGVGMDVVADAVRTLKGRTELSSTLGVGTRLSLVIPRASVGL